MKNNYNPTDKKFLKKIGLKIREIRLMNDLSQEELSFMCNLDRTYVGSVERGERNISILNLKKIANALKIEINKIFEDGQIKC